MCPLRTRKPRALTGPAEYMRLTRRAGAAQTLTDKEYQRLRDASVAIIREMGVECGGSNVQMAINPADGEVPPARPPQLPRLAPPAGQHCTPAAPARQAAAGARAAARRRRMHGGLPAA